MKKRLLPIPLILLIPILLLVFVVVAGVYRFTLSDEEILAKFPNQQVTSDPIVERLFALQSPNPFTVLVPETKAFAFIDTLDQVNGWASGKYDTGMERGQLLVSTKWLTSIKTHQYISVLAVSNQGSGVFYYLASFRYDQQRQRMILVDSILLGDRIEVDEVTYDAPRVTVQWRTHYEQQPMSDTPEENVRKEFVLESNLLFKSLELKGK